MIWSGLLSLMAPGLGHIYAGAWRQGARLVGMILLINLVSTLLRQSALTKAHILLLFALVPVMVVLYLWAFVGALRNARRRTHEPRPWWRTAWLAAIVIFGLNLGLKVQAAPTWRSFNIPIGAMEPALQPGDTILVDAAPNSGLPAYNDIVVFRPPREPLAFLVKRVVGLPGDRVQIRHGVLFINDQPMPRVRDGNGSTEYGTSRIVLARFIESLPDGSLHAILQDSDDQELDDTAAFDVPVGHVFVLGDNRDFSMDSRAMDQVGFVPVENLISRSGYVYFSIDGAASWSKPWEWPYLVRWGRILAKVQ